MMAAIDWINDLPPTSPGFAAVALILLCIVELVMIFLLFRRRHPPW